MKAIIARLDEIIKDMQIEVSKNTRNILSYKKPKVTPGNWKSILHDIDHRIAILKEHQRRALGKPANFLAEDLNSAMHMLEGFAFSDDSPTAGSVAWVGCHIVYKGVDYSIVDASTADTYIWWDFSETKTEFATSPTKPIIETDDVLIAINDGGTTRLMLTPGKLLPGGALIDGSVNSAELANGAIISDKLAALSVIEGKLAAGAVTADKIGALAVTEGKLGNNSVTGGKIGAGAVAESKLNLASHFMY